MFLQSSHKPRLSGSALLRELTEGPVSLDLRSLVLHIDSLAIGRAGLMAQFGAERKFWPHRALRHNANRMPALANLAEIHSREIVTSARAHELG